MEKMLGYSSVSASQEEASSSKLAMDVSSADEDKGKDAINEGDKSSSDMDLEDLRLIDEGTHLDRGEDGGRLRTIMIPMNFDLLKNTKEVVSSLL